MSSDLVFQGDFSFVNVDASSLSTLPHRQQVTRHVHGYRRWRKGQEARRLRESSKFHDAVDRSSGYRPPASRPVLHGSERTLRPAPAAAATAAGQSSTIQTLPPLIDVVLLNGNSDPFAALPVHLTATVNSLLGFQRDRVVPFIREVELRMTPKENAAARDAGFTTTWINESKAYLYDSIAIHSYLARIAANRYVFTLQPEFLRAAHEFRHQGIASLRQYMTSSSIDVVRLYRALLILLWPDSALGDRVAFQHHVAVLKDIFRSHHEVLSAASSVNLHYFSSVVYFEVQYAVMGLSSTSLDLGHNEWVEQQFWPLWKQVSPGVPFSRPDAQQNLDPGLLGDIRMLYLDAQEILDLIASMRMHGSVNTSLTWFYAISKTILTVGRLINLYVQLDIEDLLHHPHVLDMTGSATQRLETAAASLCAVYWLRELAGIEGVAMTENMRLFTWNPTMLGKLKQVVMVYNTSVQMNAAQHRDIDGPSRLLLWVVWTGAMAEHSFPHCEAGARDDQNWFTGQFCHLSRRANVHSVSRCQGILDRFLQLHGMRPGNDDAWYARCFPPMGEPLTSTSTCLTGGNADLMTVYD
ncbi:hypothetical protein PV04_07250 [Phialophora macrospora]|uniref:Transcription factor domain-containing protein n=1 Tax=Phialophora macrospora TaxID=1851006 RepID=A0A0D2CIC8_9EURO|nr:hypothetical protein PV04_07250 [Phialophora macrospora]